MTHWSHILSFESAPVGVRFLLFDCILPYFFVNVNRNCDCFIYFYILTKADSVKI